MALTKYKLGQLIEPIDERNAERVRRFFGINILKQFMPTVADTDEIDERKYKVVRKNRFVFSGMQTGRDKCIRIAMYDKDIPIVVSPAYVTFEVIATDKVLPEYLFMFFCSREKDRLGWFHSDTSVRSNLDWSEFCDIEIKLPSFRVQKKYVAIYNAMKANVESYEHGLGDLKLSCDALIERQKRMAKKVSMARLLKEVDVRNAGQKVKEISGINIDKEFMPSTADVRDVSNYKIVLKNQFAYSSMQTGRDKCIRIALNGESVARIVSPAYYVFKVANDDVLPEWIALWFGRREVDRRGWFLSDSSVRANLDIDRFAEIEVPVPSKTTQAEVVGVYKAYVNGKKIVGKLNDELKTICPVLIKGSLDEGKRK